MTEEEHKLLVENNIMLREIIKYIKYVIAHADDENNNDFIRNIAANVISTNIERTVYPN